MVLRESDVSGLSQDGERCAKTLKSIFENAKDPDRVFVGVIEQNSPEDKFCLEEYCKSFGKFCFLVGAMRHFL